MHYIIDRDRFGEIICIVKALSVSKTDNVYIVDEWKVMCGAQPFIGDMNKLYRNFGSLKSDKRWVEAVFEYWFDE